MAEESSCVIVGVDTHKEFHTVAIVTEVGQRLGFKNFNASAKGYKQAFEWASLFGKPIRAGVEACGSYGAGICSYLRKNDIEVFDVYAPDKSKRRRYGKSDSEDAYQAAEAALSFTRCAIAKDTDVFLDSICLLKVAYEQAVKQRTATINALRSALVILPDSLRARLRDLSVSQLVVTCGGFRVSTQEDSLTSGTKTALRSLAKRIQSLEEEIALLDKEIKRYAKALLPHTLSLFGVGHHGATTFLRAVGLNISRMKSEGSFSMLCGVSPIAASTGDNCRHRLNRGGDRKANRALYTMAIVRIKHCEKTKAFVDNKMAKKKSKRDAIRILKRYLAREVYKALQKDISSLGLAV